MNGANEPPGDAVRMTTKVSSAVQSKPRTVGAESIATRILSVVALAYAAFAGLRTVGDPDLGWQLATGRWIVAHHRIPFTDVLSYTANGREWIYPALSQLLLYGTYRLGGYALLSWLAAVVCVASVALLLRRATFATALLAVLAVPLIATSTPALASMFTVLLFAALLSVLWQFHQVGRAPLWMLPWLMCLWVNLHMGFVSGLGLLAAYVGLEGNELFFSAHREPALRRLRQAAPWLAAAAAATLANPWGVRIYVEVLRQGGINRIHEKWIGHWLPLRMTLSSLVDALQWREPESDLFWLIAVAAIAAILALYMRRPVAAIMLIASAYLVIHAVRFQGLFAIVTVVVGGAMIEECASRWKTLYGNERGTFPRDGLRARAGLILALLLISGLAGIRTWDLVTERYYLRTKSQFGAFGTGEAPWYPKAAAEFLRRQQLPANVFNDYNSGGSIAWELGPAYPDFIDGRAVPFGARLFFTSMAMLNEGPDGAAWQRETANRGIHTAIVSLYHDGGAGLASLKKFCESPQWRPVYLDSQGAVFLEVQPDQTAQLHPPPLNCDEVQFHRPPVGIGKLARVEQLNYYLNAATVLIMLDRDDDAMAAVEAGERIYAENPFLHYAKGVLLQNRNQYSLAEQELLKAIELQSDDALYALARLYHDQGRFAEEVAVLSRASDRSSQPATLYLKLAFAQIAAGQPQIALRSVERAEEASPYIGEGAEFGAAFQAQATEARNAAIAAMRGSRP